MPRIVTVAVSNRLNPSIGLMSANQNRRAYRALAVRVRRLASDLAGLGVKRGDTVAIIDSESHQYSESFFAAQGSARC